MCEVEAHSVPLISSMPIPNCAKYLKVWYICDGRTTDQVFLLLAQLTVFQRMDAPVAPGSKGMSLFVHGMTDEDRQLYRDQLFAVDTYVLLRRQLSYMYIHISIRAYLEPILDPNSQQLQHVAGTYLLNKDAQKSIVVLGPADNAAAVAASGPDWTVLSVENSL